MLGEVLTREKFIFVLYVVHQEGGQENSRVRHKVFSSFIPPLPKFCN